MTNMCYIGRFAPSPSGALHFGSFVTALGSYLQAKANQGQWLVRIEDIDQPRVVKGAADNILYTLDKLGLYWDQKVLYQSQCLDRYQTILQSLIDNQLVYYCDCNRKRIKTLDNMIYDGHCRNRYLSFDNHSPMAIRLKQHHPIYDFSDKIRGHQTTNSHYAQEDFTLFRKDGLFAYNFVVVLDDYYQGVTEIIRGVDILPVTTQQLSLYQLFGWQKPDYAHLPLALNSLKNKLSKQNHAKPILLNNIKQLLIDGLLFLDQQLPDLWQDMSYEQLLKQAIINWNIMRVPKENIAIKQ